MLPLAVGVLCTSSAFLFPVNSLVSQPGSAHRRQLRPIRLTEKVSPFNTDPPSRTDWQLGQTKSFSWLVAWQTLQAFEALASLCWDTSNLTAQNLFVPFFLVGSISWGSKLTTNHIEICLLSLFNQPAVAFHYILNLFAYAYHFLFCHVYFILLTFVQVKLMLLIICEIYLQFLSVSNK